MAKSVITRVQQRLVVKMTVKISTFKIGSEWFSVAYFEDLRLVANSSPSKTPEDARRSLISSLRSGQVREYQESPPNPQIIKEFELALRAKEGSLKLFLGGLSQFQRDVLCLTSNIPPGRVTTYKNIAIAIGKPNAQRAVGNALANNPFPIIIPCHRVIRSDLRLGGYSGTLGPKTKELLLRREGISFQNGKVMEKFLLAPDMLSYRSSLCP